MVHLVKNNGVPFWLQYPATHTSYQISNRWWIIKIQKRNFNLSAVDVKNVRCFYSFQKFSFSKQRTSKENFDSSRHRQEMLAAIFLSKKRFMFKHSLRALIEIHVAVVIFNITARAWENHFQKLVPLFSSFKLTNKDFHYILWRKYKILSSRLPACKSNLPHLFNCTHLRRNVSTILKLSFAGMWLTTQKKGPQKLRIEFPNLKIVPS